jgi:hypothetical protein
VTPWLGPDPLDEVESVVIEGFQGPVGPLNGVLRRSGGWDFGWSTWFGGVLVVERSEGTAVRDRYMIPMHCVRGLYAPVRTPVESAAPPRDAAPALIPAAKRRVQRE